MSLTIDWSQINAGPIAIIVSMFIIAAGFAKFGPRGSEAITTLEHLTSAQDKRLGERDKRITELEAAGVAQSEQIHDLEDDVHQRERTILERDAEIARLNERPSTEALHAAIEKQHAENQAVQQQIVETLTGVDQGIREMGAGITRLLERDQDRRS